MKCVGSRGTLLFSLFLVSQWSHGSTGFPGTLVEVNSEEGQARLARAAIRADFESLVYNFELQTNRDLSAAASATTVLNSLRGEDIDRAVRAAQAQAQASGQPQTAKPKDPKSAAAPKVPAGVDMQYKRYTQKSFFTPEVEKIKPFTQVAPEPDPEQPIKKQDTGLKLAQLARALRAHGLKVNLRITERGRTEKQIRSELVSNLSRGGDYVIVGYNRIALGQKAGETFAPVGAYDKTSDSFLVMDVNSSITPWIWVRTKDLAFAIQNRDSSDQHGYVLVADGIR